MSRARITWGPNVLDFDSLEDAYAFARELGARELTYWPMWHSHAADDTPNGPQ